MFVEETVDDGVDQDRGPGEDVGDHVEPAQGGGWDRINYGEDRPGCEADNEGYKNGSEALG